MAVRRNSLTGSVFSPVASLSLELSRPVSAPTTVKGLLREANALAQSLIHELEQDRLPPAAGSPAGEFHDLARETREGFFDFRTISFTDDLERRSWDRVEVRLRKVRTNFEELADLLARVKANVTWLSVYQFSRAAVSLLDSISELAGLSQADTALEAAESIARRRANVFIARRALAAGSPTEAAEVLRGPSELHSHAFIFHDMYGFFLA